MHKITYEAINHIPLAPEFVTFSLNRPNEIGPTHRGAISTTNSIRLESALGDILPAKSEAVGVRQKLCNRDELGWHFNLSYAQDDAMELVMKAAGGHSAYLRSKKLIR